MIYQIEMLFKLCLSIVFFPIGALIGFYCAAFRLGIKRGSSEAHDMFGEEE